MLVVGQQRKQKSTLGGTIIMKMIPSIKLRRHDTRHAERSKREGNNTQTRKQGRRLLILVVVDRVDGWLADCN